MLAYLVARWRTGGARRAWLAGAVAAALSTNFSTGRSTLVVPALMGGLVLLLGTVSQLTLCGAAAAGLAVTVIALASFAVGGSLIGKTFENSRRRCRCC